MELPGLNVQWPWSELLVAGQKIVETRGYKLPDHYVNKPLAIIETKNPKRNNKACIIGVVVFGESYKYPTKTAWMKESSKHLVKSDDANFKFQADRPKWGWPVVAAEKIEDTPPPRRRGIIFASECKIKDKK